MRKQNTYIAYISTFLLVFLALPMLSFAHAGPLFEAAVRNSQTVTEFVWLGMTHIWEGYDHILFLLGVIIIGLSGKDTVKIITSFTIAHSITLLLAAMQIIDLPSKFVEVTIALSICVIATDNILRKDPKNHRWMITFAFGLIHGFGFASVLRELIQNKSSMLVSVISFNIGVEIGQIVIFLVVLPVLYLLKKKVEFRKFTVSASSLVFSMGFIWMIERLFGITILGI